MNGLGEQPDSFGEPIEDIDSEPDETTLENVRYLLGEIELPEERVSIEDVPEAEEDELEEFFFGEDIEGRLSQIDQFVKSRPDMKADHGQLEFLQQLLEIDASETPLVQLYEDRDFDISRVLDLVLYTIDKKQQLFGPDELPDSADLLQTAEGYPHGRIKRELDQQTIEEFSALEFDGREIRLAIELANPRQNLMLHLVGWLARREFMKDFRERVQIRSRRRLLTLNQLGDTALKMVDLQADRYIHKRKKLYNWSIDFERSAALRRGKMLKVTKALSQLVLLGEKMKI